MQCGARKFNSFSKQIATVTDGVLVESCVSYARRAPLKTTPQPLFALLYTKGRPAFGTAYANVKEKNLGGVSDALYTETQTGVDENMVVLNRATDRA